MARNQRSPITQELIRLADQHNRNWRSEEVREQVRQRWRDIWEEFGTEERLASLDTQTVENILLFGSQIMTVQKDHRAAAVFLTRYFTHPEVACFRRLGDGIIDSLQVASHLLHAGDEETALDFLRMLIGTVPKPRYRRALWIAQMALRGFGAKQEGGALASFALTDLAQEVIHGLKRHKVRRWQPGGKPYAELVQILFSTLPAKERDTAIARVTRRE